MENGASSWLSALSIKVIRYALNQGSPTYGACTKCGALDDWKWHIACL